jgi:hypothetical protein
MRHTMKNVMSLSHTAVSTAKQPFHFSTTGTMSNIPPEIWFIIAAFIAEDLGDLLGVNSFFFQHCNGHSIQRNRLSIYKVRVFII